MEIKEQPEWQIERDEYLERIKLNTESFKNHLKLPDINSIKRILPLRNIKEITSLLPIDRELLVMLLKQIKTPDGRMPFSNIESQITSIYPPHLKIGQKFVYRENYTNLFEEAPNIFKDFFVTSGGLGDVGPYFVFGKDYNDFYSMACYLPPIVEKHGHDLVIMDGIHRNYIKKQGGGTLVGIVLINVGLPFPCAAKNWSDIKVISLTEKPKDINERYFDLQKNLFRDLKYLGIDG